ncbi:MAG TPA: enoyl-CoA hydratase-related protein, partial [Syntrophales bacterium]|nr:enoyl-CoA hydratase-related protein [Syntrophales bacterium]
MEKTVLFEVEDGVALITLNRPERHNAICQDLLINLYNYVDEVADNDEIRVAIITGAGRSFCSGIDLSVIGTDNLLNPRGDGKDFPDVLRPCNKPIIGAINGNTITGGFELALNCDFIIASDNASFLDSHAKVGIHPSWGMTQLLQDKVGRSMARQLSLSCEQIPAARAQEIGLANEVVPADKLMERCMEIAGKIAG